MGGLLGKRSSRSGWRGHPVSSVSRWGQLSVHVWRRWAPWGWRYAERALLLLLLRLRLLLWTLGVVGLWLLCSRLLQILRSRLLLLRSLPALRGAIETSDDERTNREIGGRDKLFAGTDGPRDERRIDGDGDGDRDSRRQGKAWRWNDVQTSA